MKKLFWFLLSVGVLTSCKQGSQTNTENPAALDLQSTLPGTWELVSISVKINSFENTDSSFVEEIREEQWERDFFVKPARTYYELDNKFRRAHLDMRDSIMSEARGMWNTFNDTLMMIEPDATYQYKVSQQPNGLLRFFTFLDWDNDGQEDDEYVGVHRYISRSTN